MQQLARESLEVRVDPAFYRESVCLSNTGSRPQVVC